MAADDPGLRALFDAVGAAVTWQPGQRYVLVTTAEPVVVSFAIGDRRYDVGPVSQTAGFAPFFLDGHAYIPFDELVHALDLAVKEVDGQTILQPQLASIDLENTPAGTKLIARAGMPLDARISSQSDDRLVVAFDGVGTTLQRSRSIASGPVRRIDLRTEGTPAHPQTIATFYLAPGASHSAPGTDDQRDFTMAFNAAANSQPVAVASAPPSPAAMAPASPQPQSTPEQAAPPAVGPAQITSVQLQGQSSALGVRVAVSGNATYVWHRLRPPDNRFWIDIQHARLMIPPLEEAGSGSVNGVRAHQQSGDTVRVALSLADFQTVRVTPDAGGVTVSVGNTVASTTAPRTGSGTIGDAAVANASPVQTQEWKYSRSVPTYVSANPRLIVIDPGHGGSDPGSYRGDVVEKALTLDMSKRLRDILIARGWQVVMTRESDKDVYAANDSASDELQARDDVANSNGARLFVSIHVNAFINAGPHGATVYYYKPIDLSFAQAIDRRIATEVNVKDDGTVKDKLYVVHHANMPAALVETAFVSNPDDLVLLQSPGWRQKMAQAIADGIADYAGPAPAGNSGAGQ